MKPFKDIDERQMEAPVINTDITHDDFYKFAMGSFIFHKSPYAVVEFAFKNRTKEVELARFVSEEDFMREFENFRKNARANRTSLHYLRGTDEYDVRMFDERYLKFLGEELDVPQVKFNITNDGQLDIRASGEWKNVSWVEIAVLKIVNTLYYRSVLSKMSLLEREALYAEGIRRFNEKVITIKKFAKENPGFTYSDFGNRRAFGPGWHEYLVERQAEELQGIFLGPSATNLAINTCTMPMGTNAHELQMVWVAKEFDGTKDSIVKATKSFLHNWWDFYGKGLSICLSDTYGSSLMFEIMSDSQIKDWKGFRQDSGDVIKFGEAQIKRTKEAGVDPREKILVPSDGLKMNDMFNIFLHFINRIKTSFGWGTNLTNDLGLGTLSIVMKPVRVGDTPTVKLSDNIAKAICEDPAVLKRYKEALGYDVTFNQTPTV